MDYAYKFEELINKYVPTTGFVTFANNWTNKNERVALLFTACIAEYDKNSSGEIGKKLEYFMEELFNDSKSNKEVSIECLNFLTNFKSK
ncbi:hypothetical protein [Sinomicrobium oceani]|uniref:hypothetical protein n=1 Tax=Sinomicrobium oceani TaxID=1150368 RepID=UPI00227A83D4|nr:hypothetical protein [Sinomicrobium oceani]